MTTMSPLALARVMNRTRGTTVAERARWARTFRTRLLGLMGRADLPAEEALIFAPCRGVHTHFMRFPIDLLFVDVIGEGAGRVVKVREHMGPFRTDLGSSDLLLELPAGTIARTGTAVADELDVLPVVERGA
jgi:uncharacterized membrane protein (UPF0127 family)